VAAGAADHGQAKARRAEWSARQFVRDLDPRTKLLLLLLTCGGAFLASGLAKLLVVLGISLAWVLLAGAPAGSSRRLTRLALVLGVLGGAVALCARARGGSVSGVFEPLARLAPILLASWAFSVSTPPGQLAAGLQRMRLPRSVVFVALAARSFLPVLTSEVRMGYDAARLKMRETPGNRLVVFGRVAWRALVSLCLRLTQCADELAAAAELRAVAKPGPRSSLRPVRVRFCDIALVVAGGAGMAALLAW